MKTLLATCVAVLLACQPAFGQSTDTAGLAHRAAGDLVDGIDLGRLADLVNSSVTADNSVSPACLDIQRRALRAELVDDHELIVEAFADAMTQAYSQQQLQVGSAFLESPTGKEVLEAAFANASGQPKALSEEARRNLQTLAGLPDLRSFVARLGEVVTSALNGDLKATLLSRLKRRFAAMAAEASQTCPSDDLQ